MTGENTTALYSTGKKPGINKYRAIKMEHAIIKKLQPRRIPLFNKLSH